MPSPVLVLQATNAGVRRPGYEAIPDNHRVAVLALLTKAGAPYNYLTNRAVIDVVSIITTVGSTCAFLHTGSCE